MPDPVAPSPSGDAGSGPSPTAPGLGFPGAFSVFVSPERTFRDLAARPRRAWVGPIVLCAVIATLATWIMLPEILEAAYTAAVTFMDKVGVPDERRAEALANLPLDVTPHVIVTQVLPNLITVPVFILIGATFVHLVSRAFGSQSRFGPTLGMFAVGYVIWATGGLVRGIVAGMSDTIEVTLGPGALLPNVPVLSPWGIVLDLFDVFSLWHLYVLVAGVAVVTRVSRGTAWGVALSYWVVRSLILAGGKGFMLWTQGG